MKSKITVAIINYNHGKYLDEAINSAINQTEPANSVLVIDDGSTDDSRAVINSFSSHIRSIFKSNTGQRDSSNLALDMCDTEFVVFLDADDVLLPTALGMIAEAFATSESISKVQWRLELIDEKSRALNMVIPTVLNGAEAGSNLKDKGLLYYSPPSSGNAYRTSVLKAFGSIPLSPSERHGADYFFIYAACLGGDIYSIDRILGRYRIIDVAEARISCAMGNAARNSFQISRSEERSKEFISWIEKSAVSIDLNVAPLISTPAIKEEFSSGIDNSKNWIERVTILIQFLRNYGIRLIGDPWRHSFFKVSLIAWMIVVSIFPKSLSNSILKYGANKVAR